MDGPPTKIHKCDRNKSTQRTSLIKVPIASTSLYGNPKQGYNQFQIFETKEKGKTHTHKSNSEYRQKIRKKKLTP